MTTGEKTLTDRVAQIIFEMSPRSSLVLTENDVATIVMSLVEEDVAAGEYEGCSSELDLAAGEYDARIRGMLGFSS